MAGILARGVEQRIGTDKVPRKRTEGPLPLNAVLYGRVMSLLGWRSSGHRYHPDGWSLQVERHGPAARLLYREGDELVTLSFELGGTVGGFIYPPAQWQAAPARQAQVMMRVAQEFISREFAGYRFEIDDLGVATILK